MFAGAFAGALLAGLLLAGLFAAGLFPRGIKLLNDMALFFFGLPTFVNIFAAALTAPDTAFVAAFTALEAALATAFTAPMTGLGSWGAGDAFIST